MLRLESNVWILVGSSGTGKVSISVIEQFRFG